MVGCAQLKFEPQLSFSVSACSYFMYILIVSIVTIVSDTGLKQSQDQIGHFRPVTNKRYYLRNGCPTNTEKWMTF